MGTEQLQVFVNKVMDHMIL